MLRHRFADLPRVLAPIAESVLHEVHEGSLRVNQVSREVKGIRLADRAARAHRVASGRLSDFF